MKLKAVKWTLAILFMAPCMQAQSVWNTTHLANVKRSIREPVLRHSLRGTEEGSGQTIGRTASFCHDERKDTRQR